MKGWTIMFAHEELFDVSTSVCCLMHDEMNVLLCNETFYFSILRSDELFYVKKKWTTNIEYKIEREKKGQLTRVRDDGLNEIYHICIKISTLFLLFQSNSISI